MNFLSNLPSRFQIFIVLSKQAPAIVLLSGLKLILVTQSLLAWGLGKIRLSQRHKIIVLSLPADAKVNPSGLKLTLYTQLLCPRRVASKLPSRLQILTVSSILADARV